MRTASHFPSAPSSFGPQGNIDDWQEQLFILIPKHGAPKSVTEYRPISIMQVLAKLYHKMLAISMARYVKIVGFLQYGARAGHQCIEVIMLLRLVWEKSTQWSRPVVLGSLDILKAFDCLDFEAIW